MRYEECCRHATQGHGDDVEDMAGINELRFLLVYFKTNVESG